MSKTKWYLILNPSAGKGKGAKRWASIQKSLQKTGIAYDLGISEHQFHPIQLAKEAVLKGYKKIIVVGGDGTINEVVNGICGQDQVPTKELTMAIIPVGLGNDWIKTHKIPKNHKKAILLLSMGNTQTHDIGKVLYHNEAGLPKYRYFINVAGLGYDAFVTKETKIRSKFVPGFFSYLYLILTCLTKFKPSKTKVSFDAEMKEYPFYNITIGLGRYNGGGTQLVPQAIPNDGLFALTLFKNIAPWEIIFKAPKLYTGSITNHPKAFLTKAKHILIEAPKESPAYVEADGEWLGQTPVEFFMLEEAINIMVP